MGSPGQGLLFRLMCMDSFLSAFNRKALCNIALTGAKSGI